jgi:hypothetical protein
MHPGIYVHKEIVSLIIDNTRRQFDGNVKVDSLIYTKDELIQKVKQAKKEWESRAYPDTEADGFVYCGKCGKLS